MALEERGITRRTFLSATAALGALQFLGGYARESRLTLAYADEAGETHFVVYVLSREDVPVLALNVEGGRNVPAAGMEVTLTSQYNGKTVTVTTDDMGCAVANIRALSEDASNDDAPYYCCWLSVRAHAKGLRSFENPQIFVRSAQPAGPDGTMSNVIQIPTQTDTSEPYFSLMSLDDADVQYTPREIGLVAENDATHTLDLRLENADYFPSTADNSWIFELVSDGEVIAHTTATRKETTVTTALKGQWLDGEHGIVPGSKLTLRFRPASSSYDASFALPQTFAKATLPVPNGFVDDHCLSVGQSETQPKDKTDPPKGNSFSWFVKKDDSFNLGLPFIPVNIFADRLGNVGVTATLATADIYKSKDGQKADILPKDRWKYINDLSGSGWIESFEDNFWASAEHYFDACASASSRDSVFGSSKATSSFAMTFSVDVMGVGKRTESSDVTRHYHMDLGASGKFSLAYNSSIQFAVIGIPCYAAFDFSAAALAKILSGIQFNDGFENIDFGHKLSRDFPVPLAFIIDICAEVGLSLGIGVFGILSVGVRGFGNFDICLMFDANDDESHLDKPSPHVVITAKAAIEAVVQALFFKKSIQLVSSPAWTIADSWDKKLAIPADGGMPDSRFGTSVAQLANGGTSDMEMVTEKSLAKCVEFSTRLDNLGVTSSFKFSGKNLDKAVPKPGIVDPYKKAPDEGDALLGSLDYHMGAFGQGYNPARGVRPTSKTKLWEDAFSAPRARVVTTKNGTYLLRIAMVEVDVAGAASNLSVVRSANGNLFAQPLEQNTLPCVAFESDGSDGPFLRYPEYDGDVVCARFDFLAVGKDLLSNSSEDAEAFAKRASRHATMGKSAGESTLMRSRVTISTLRGTTWSDPQVLDFAVPASAPDLLRANMWDADFDVAVAPSGDLYLSIGGLVRTEESTSFDDQFERQFVSIMRLDTEDMGIKEVQVVSVPSEDGQNVCWHPRVAVHAAAEYEQPSIHFYRRLNGRNVLRHMIWTVNREFGTWDVHSVPGEAQPPSGFVYTHMGEGTFSVKSANIDNNIENTTFTYVWSCPAQEADEATGTAAHDALTCIWGVDAVSGVPISGEKQLSGSAEVYAGPARSEKGCASFTWLYSIADSSGRKRVLRRLNATSDGKKLSFDETWPVGHLSEATRFFVSEDGTRLFAARGMEGTAPALPDDAVKAIENGAALFGSVGRFNSTAAAFESAARASGEAEVVQQFQLLCASYDAKNDTFGDFFPLAELDFAPDTLLEIPGSLWRDSYDFICGTITDMDHNLLDVYHVSVPQVAGIQLEGAGAVTNFALPGDPCLFNVSVSNTGNMPLYGFTASVFDAETDAEIGSADLMHLDEALQPSESRMIPVYDGDGMPTDEFEMVKSDADKNGLLWPGCVRDYQARITLPKDMETGEHRLKIRISDPLPDDPMQTKLLADGGADSGSGSGSGSGSNSSAPVLCVDPRARHAKVAVSDKAQAETTLLQANYKVAGEDDDTKPEKPTDDTKPPRKDDDVDPLPKTGDSLPVRGALTAAAASAAVAAFCKVAAAKEQAEDSDSAQ